jgi:hypothetical protein
VHILQTVLRDHFTITVDSVPLNKLLSFNVSYFLSLILPAVLVSLNSGLLEIALEIDTVFMVL